MIFRSLKYLIPDKVKTQVKALLFPNKNTWWKGDYTSWDKALTHCTGYNDDLILQKVKQAVLKVKRGEALYERDSVLFNEPYYFEPLVKALNASAKNNSLNVLDFGGSLGSTYFQYKPVLDGVKELNWAVVEQKNYVETGKNELSEGSLQFYETVKEALGQHQAQVLLLSSVLPYLKDPYAMVKELLQYKFDAIIIDRTNFIKRKKDRLTVQQVPKEIYEASYPCWFFNEQRFLSHFLEAYEIQNEFMNEIPPPERLGRDEVYWKGFYMKRKGSTT